MSDKERAKKLAAAKKKLKEYQSKEKHNTDVDSSDASEYGGNNNTINAVIGAVGNANAKQSHQYHEEFINKTEQQQVQHQNNNHQQQHQDNINITPQSQQSINNSISDYFNNLSNIQSIDINSEPLSVSEELPSSDISNNQNSVNKSSTTSPQPPTSSLSEKSSNNNHHVNTIEILISEKTALTTELTKQQTLCKEKMLECEELSMQLQIIKNHNKLLENEINDLHLKNSNLYENFNDIMKKYEKKNNDYDIQNRKINELQEHFDEIKCELNNELIKTQKLEKELKDKKCELELCQIRINQISDETNLVSDNRVEALTQTKFMYEQQICDLQSMVQQLTTERDQLNQQYQNYVQHLNKEMTTIIEKNSELNNENERLSNRERQLIEHIGNLEKQIQENIAKQEFLKETINEQSSSNEISTTATTTSTTNNFDENLQLLKEKIENLNLEKIQLENEKKLQDDKLQDNYKKLLEKDNIIYELEDKLDKIISEKPNHNKLLATIESDKIAASRALIQNEELKNQLDEIQKKLIQITNDKADLIQELDTEKYTNRKIHENYNEMEKQLKDTTEKLHFKDEEMIRLTHEHNELNKTILQLNQRIDRLMHYEAKEYMRQRQEKHELETTENSEEKINNDNLINTNGNSELMENNHHNNHHHDHDHGTGHHHHDHDHDHDNHDDHHHDHDHDHKQDEIQNQRKVDSIETDSKIQSELENHKKMPSEKNSSDNELSSTRCSERNCDDKYNNKLLNGIEQNEAMEKLQERFRKIMLENADLCDEKQRLEHLVCQLQYETETIGEYITLYQTQRRLLKQREIEKQTQLHILLNEREEMKDKIKNLTQLFDNLCEIYIKNDINNDNTINKIILTSDNSDNNQTKPIDIEKTTPTTPTTTTTLSTIKNDKNNENFEMKNFIDLEYNNKLQQKQQIINNNPILMKIQNIITEIKDKEENLEANLKLIPSVDHCACCQGKYETI